MIRRTGFGESGATTIADERIIGSSASSAASTNIDTKPNAKLSRVSDALN